MTVASDEELILAVAAGEEDALAALLGRHQGLVRGYLVKRLPTVEDAEEAAQDVFLKLDRGAATFNGTGAFRPWLMAIARNVLRDRLRRSRDRREVPLVTDRIEVYRSTHRDEEVRAAIRTLPRRYRAALTLKYLLGLSYREAAAELELTEKGFETRLLRARVRLREALLRGRRSDHGLS